MHEETARLLDDTVILFGFWTACTRDTHFDSSHCYLQSESPVSVSEPRVRSRTNMIVNGNYIAADNTFIEKRRRGLARFANALVRHPVLSQEQLVIMFLTVPTVSLGAPWSYKAVVNK